MNRFAGRGAGIWPALLLAGMAMLPVPPGAAAGLEVRVLKNSVNLRAQPVADAEVVGQAQVGEVLAGKSARGEWVEVAPPAAVDLWILADYVQDGVIRSRQHKVNVRSGPGINFAVVGQLPPGAPVTVRGLFRDWVKIAPPAACSLWVAKSLVEVSPPKSAAPVPPVAVQAKPVSPPAAARIETSASKPVAAPVPKPLPPAKPAPPPPPPPAPPPPPPVPAQPAPSPAVTSAPAVALQAAPPPAKPAPAAPPPAQVPVLARLEPDMSAPSAVAPEPPSDLELLDIPEQGQWRQYDGVLRPRGVLLRTPSRYRLVGTTVEGRSVTVCYVKGNQEQLAALINRPLIVSGREYWVRKQTYPVLVPERIVLKQ